MSETFLFMMLGLKLPIVGLGCIIWWALRQDTESTPTADGGDGGIRPHHPRRPLPRPPRRGPHGDPPLAAPPRVRGATARARQLEH